MRIAGRNPVLERIRANPKSVVKIYLQEGLKEQSVFARKAKQWGIPLIIVPRTKMVKISRGINTQGVMADVEDFAYADYDDVLDQARKKHRTIIFLDGVTDPQNLGAIIRTAGCLGKFAIVLPTHDSVKVTQAVLRIASGGENYLPICQVKNINKALVKARELGFTVAGTVVEGGEDLGQCRLSFPLCVVMGSEQKGVRDVIQKNLDLRVTIPMSIHTLSLNVAQATTILCYEITRQKNQNKG